MDLQDIKKEIESLRKDTLNVSKNTEIYLFGLTKIKLAIIFIVAALIIYVVKPIYIYDFEVQEDKEIKRRMNYKRISITYLICVALLFTAFKYINFNYL